MKITVSDADRRTLEKWLKSRATTPKQKQRARIILMSAEGRPTSELMETLKLSNPTLNRWRRRYQEGGIDALRKGKSKAPGINPLAQEKVQEVLSLTLTGKPVAATHWSCRTLAKQVGISKSAVNRIWRAHKLKPHQVKGFKVSNDRQFEEKLRDVVGLYLDPPEKAIVFSVDEKSQIQALDRTQPGLPLKRGKAGTMTHDYKRNGTTTLFAALNVHEGTVIGECLPKHRNDEFLAFLKRLDRETDKTLDVHLYCGQLRHPQAPERQRLVGQAPSVSHAFHAHVGILGELG